MPQEKINTDTSFPKKNIYRIGETVYVVAKHLYGTITKIDNDNFYWVQHEKDPTTEKLYNRKELYPVEVTSEWSHISKQAGIPSFKVKEKEMINSSKTTKTLKEFKIEITAPTANEENTIVHVDTEENIVIIDYPSYPKNEREGVNIPVEKRFNVEQTKVSVVDGLITVIIPVREGIIIKITK